MTADEIRTRRESLGISKAALARAAGMHPATISHIETGHLVPYPGQIEKLEAAFEEMERARREEAGL